MVKALRCYMVIAAVIGLAVGLPAHAQEEPDHIRGQITQVEDTSIVVKSLDGKTVRLAIPQDLTVISLDKGSFTKVDFMLASEPKSTSAMVRDRTTWKQTAS